MSKLIYVAKLADGYVWKIDGELSEHKVDAKLSTVKGLARDEAGVGSKHSVHVINGNQVIELEQMDQYIYDHMNKPQVIVAPSVEEAAAGAVATPIEDAEPPSLEVDLFDEDHVVVEVEKPVVNTLLNKQNGQPRNSKAVKAITEDTKADEPVQETIVKPSKKTSKMKEPKKRGRKARQVARKAAQKTVHYGFSTPLQGLHTVNQFVIDFQQGINDALALGIGFIDMQNGLLEVTPEELQYAIAEWVKRTEKAIPAADTKEYEAFIKARTMDAFVYKVKARSDSNIQGVVDTVKAPIKLAQGAKYMMKKMKEMQANAKPA
jgi:hypothetical protein